MANLPAKADQSSLSEADERFTEALADAIAAGRRPAEIAKRLAPNDRRRQKQIRARVRHMLYTDVNLANRLAERARAEFLMGLVPAAKALSERAGRGRPDAVKLLFEASGFHNPRVKHDHTGEIKVKLEIPRPKFDEDIQDADVVDVSP